MLIFHFFNFLDDRDVLPLCGGAADVGGRARGVQDERRPSGTRRPRLSQFSPRTSLHSLLVLNSFRYVIDM